MGVDAKVVDYVASLAKLNLADEEREAIAEQLRRILEYVDQLQEVDVDDVPPTKHVIDLFNVSRGDTPGDSLPVEQALENAPAATHGYFAVPKVLPD
jgi:aspartyl-tRNA(Asn)/glutamyl-tRNA(Gln) amidotransferase subunit C